MEAKALYGVEFADMSQIKYMDAIVLAVAHETFKNLKIADIDNLYNSDKKILVDVKGILNRKEYESAGYSYWRL